MNGHAPQERSPQASPASGPASGPASAASWRVDDPGLLEALETVPLDGIDDVGFGLIVMDRDGRVTGYNRAESQLSGLPPEEVTGRNFFVEVGPCTNNYLIAQRYQDDDDLDEQIDYVFTYRMSPTPVRLRLMARRGSSRQYLAVRLR